MRVLVLGGGGREHALCHALSRAASVEGVLCAPGNAGIAAVAACVGIDPADPSAVVALARREAVDLVVIGPEAPLVAGVADALLAAGVAVFGPTAAAAEIEGSKAFAKSVMAAAGVPTAAAWSGSDVDGALAALDRFGPPYVVKADGLAAGKGVVVTPDRTSAERAVRAALEDRAFGEAGARIVVEEHLSGPEISLFALCDGETVLPLVAAQDYKRIGDGDEGPNTGGMGAYSPVPALDDPAAIARLSDAVFRPTVRELARSGRPYVGVLFAGLVLTADGPKVLEFNARFGDPETQVVLPRLQTDLGALLASCAHGELAELARGRMVLEWDARACVTVVLASGGYPGPYETGLPITGIDEAAALPDVLVFSAGTRDEGGQVVTAGGRVLAVSALGDTIAAARERAYTAADRIRFPGCTRRSDIAAAPTLPPAR